MITICRIILKLGAAAAAFIFFATPLYSEDHNALPNWGRGPIELEDQYFFSLLHLSSRPMSPSVIKKGDGRISVTGALSNSEILKKEAYIVDYESRTAYIDFSAGLTERLEASIRLPIIWRGSGSFDSDIESIHELFSLPQGSRNNLENDHFIVSGRDNNGKRFNFQKTGSGLGNLALQAKYLISAGDASLPALSLYSAISLPTARDTYGHQGLDYLISLLTSKRSGALVGYAGLSFLYYSDDEINNVGYTRFHPEIFAGGEYELSESFSIYTGVLSAIGERAEVSVHPDYSLYWDLGLSVDLFESSALRVLVRQNPGASKGSADISLLLGFSTPVTF